MTSENKAPERIWLGRDNRYVGAPWLRLASDFDDEDEDGEVQEYVRADLFGASATMASRQNALIDTLRDELAAEKAKGAQLVNAVMAPEDAEYLLRSGAVDVAAVGQRIDLRHRWPGQDRTGRQERASRRVAGFYRPGWAYGED